MNEDNKLIQNSLSGDSHSFERLVEKYQATICAITFAATGRLETSEELAQETFLQAWKNLAQLREFDKFRFWLCSIARNLLRTYYQQKQADKVSICDTDTLETLATQDVQSPTDTLISREEEMILSQALMHIPKEYREPLVLYYRQQQSTKEVAESLELNEATVRTRLSRGRQMLKDQVAAMVENTLAKSGPTKKFTKAVMVGIGAGLAAGTAATAGVAAAGTNTGSAAGGTWSVLTGVGMKLAAIAAAVFIGAGAIVYYYWHSLTPLENTTQLIVEHAPMEAQQMTISKETSIATKRNTDTPQTQTQSNVQDNLIQNQQQAVSVSNTVVPEPNIPYEFKPRGVLSGLITDAQTGKPVTDAQLTIAEHRVFEAKTDKNGYYFFEEMENNGLYSVTLSSTDYVGFSSYDPPKVNLEHGKQVVRHFQLRQACKVKLTVLDEHEKPIKGAKVSACRRSEVEMPREITPLHKTMRTDQNGELLLGGFPPKDTYWLTINHSKPDGWGENENGMRYQKMKWDYAPAGIEVQLNEPNETEFIEVILKKGISVQGFAQYQDGQPANDIRVYAQPCWWQSIYSSESYPTEPNGFFTLDHILPGQYDIQIGIQNGVGSTVHSLFQKDLLLKQDDLLRIQVPFNSPKSLVSIRGKMNWIGEKRPSYVSIDARSQTGQLSTGRFSYNKQNEIKDDFIIERLETGIYNLSFYGNEIEPVRLENVQAPSDNLIVELFQRKQFYVYGSVIDASTKKAITCFQARVRKTNGDQWVSFEQDNNGFKIELPGSGKQQVQFRAEGYAPFWNQEIDTDNSSSILIALSLGGNIQGRVMDASGNPIKGAEIVPFCLSGGVQVQNMDRFVLNDGLVCTDENGKFNLYHIPAEEEKIKVSHQEYGYKIIEHIEIKENQCTEIEIILQKQGGVVEGYIYDNHGRPQNDTSIFASDSSNYVGGIDRADSLLGIGKSDPNGFYRIEGLPEKMCYLSRVRKSQVDGVTQRGIIPHYGKVSRVDFGGKHILRGRIVLDGKPLANQEIRLGQPSARIFEANTKTDTQGCFSFSGVPAGRHRICFNKNEAPYEFVDIETFQYSGDDVDLGIIPSGDVELTLTLKQPQNDPWQIRDVYLIDDKHNFFNHIKEQSKPDNMYVFKNIHSGGYSLIIIRNDGLFFEDSITIPDEDKKPEFQYTLPSNTASIFGTISGNLDEIELSDQANKVRITIQKKNDNSYAISQIPHGQYYIKLNDSGKTGTSTPIYLSPGQQLNLNIDDTQFEKHPLAQLEVIVVSENGEPIDGVDIVLKKQGQTIKPEWAYGGGQYVFFSTTPGQYLLVIHYKGYEDTQQEINLVEQPKDKYPNQKRQQIIIRLKPESKP